MNEERRYLVSELAILCGVSVKSIRYYEKYGLIRAEKASKGKSSSRFEYSAETLEKLEMIEEGKSLGLSLSQIHDLMRGWYNERVSIPDRISILKDQLKIIDEKNMKLTDVRVRICLLIDELHKFE